MALTPYMPTTWVNDSEPDIDDSNLNKIEQGIKQAIDGVNEILNALSSQIENNPAKFSSSAALYAVNESLNTVSSDLEALQGTVSTLNSNLTDITANYPVKYKTKTYNNTVLTGSGYSFAVLDTFATIGVPSNKKVIGINVLGWDGATGVFNVLKSTDGLSAVLLAPPGTFGRVTIEVAYQ